MYRAKDTFWAPDNRRIVKGDLVAPDDPVVEGREDLFEEVVIPQAVAKQPAKKPAPAKKAAPSKPPAAAAGNDKAEDGDKGGDQE